MSQELAAAGEMRQAQTFDFIFKNVEKQYESYSGINVKLRCVLRLPSSLNTRAHCQGITSASPWPDVWERSSRSGSYGSIPTECRQIPT